MSRYPRGSSAGRGYGYRHQQIRKVWAAKIAAGGVDCARCGEPIPPATPSKDWHLDHDEADPTRQTYRGASHAGCNISAPGVRGAAAAAQGRDPDPAPQCRGSADHDLYWAAGMLASHPDRSYRPDPKYPPLALKHCSPSGGHVVGWAADAGAFGSRGRGL